MYKALIKPVGDYTLALLLLPIFTPLIAVLAVVSAFVNGPGNVFFYQCRIGYLERPFTIIKFKTMRNPAYAGEGDATRLTAWGRLLRKTSADELPQLFNILAGQMSWVGPRPLLPQYLPLYSNRQKLRHTVKPGITGLAQVNGRNNTSWPQRLEWDARYAANQGFKQDINILLLTFGQLFRTGDTRQKGYDTMPPFTG